MFNKFESKWFSRYSLDLLDSNEVHNYDPMRDESKNDGSKPPFVAISGWVAINDAGIEKANANGNASIALPIKAVARLQQQNCMWHSIVRCLISHELTQRWA